MRRNGPAMFLDDALANREAQTGSLGFAVGGKRFKEPVDDLGGNSAAAVLNFGADRLLAERKAKRDRSAARHFVDGVSNQVVEDAIQSARVHRHLDGRWLIFESQSHVVRRQFVAELINGRADKLTIIGRGQLRFSPWALGEIKNVV